MAVSNLHTLHHDLLFEVLTHCPDLTTLRCCILTHPNLWHAFSTSRRLILRLVFRNQFTGSSPRRTKDLVSSVHAAEYYITRFIHRRSEGTNWFDCVAFQEGLWPLLEPLLPEKLSLEWAKNMLTAYQKAELRDDALCLVKRTIGLIMKSPGQLSWEARAFARTAVRTYISAKLLQETIALQEAVRQRFHPWQAEHTLWSKDLIATHRNAGDDDRVLQLQISCWELYKTALGPDNDATLNWARAIVREYQRRGQEQEALAFHRKVRSMLDPRAAPSIAWSRQLIHMLQRQKKHAEALAITEDVWQHLNPESAGYRAWAGQLSEQYEAMGRPEDAIAVWEAAWIAITAQLTRKPNDNSWKYHARGAGLSLAKVYQRNRHLDEASAVLAQREGF
ncbi:hypothetical protein GQ43DRAFT_437822 [Delitschia confertaspora ATCC 74209]|uniref:Tetratricopeptide repeat protein n=1 Tax=Delitschia confertaspora ATCC 74209 TaxID=1513339 RepID=A0A9P4JSL9_9PLEO|nr:hypothetical protein GQ43DRAFT_437822 [Delitschia confertaspora ATCC 74209]